EGSLFVWKQKAADPVATITMPGYVGGIGFVAPDRVALLAFTPDAGLHLYDVAKGEAVQTIPLAPGQFDPPKPPDNVGKPKFWYDPQSTVVAVSPTGRYVALGGKKGI